jgi:outer membrane beta-barrel protein
VGAELGYNFVDWFGLGLSASYGFNSPTKLTRHVRESRDIGGNATTPTDSNWPSYTGAGRFEDQVARLKGMYFLQLNFSLFRGKASFFEKAFVATDIVVFVGGGIVLFEERADCDSRDSSCGSMTEPIVNRDMKIGPTVGTYGLNFDFYINNWAAINIQLRFAPFWWNAGGTDESGQAASVWEIVPDPDKPDQPSWATRPSGGEGDYPDGKIDKQDRQINLNMSIGIGAVFLFPTAPGISD